MLHLHECMCHINWVTCTSLIHWVIIFSNAIFNVPHKSALSFTSQYSQFTSWKLKLTISIRFLLFLLFSVAALSLIALLDNQSRSMFLSLFPLLCVIFILIVSPMLSPIFSPWASVLLTGTITPMFCAFIFSPQFVIIASLHNINILMKLSFCEAVKIWFAFSQVMFNFLHCWGQAVSNYIYYMQPLSIVNFLFLLPPSFIDTSFSVPDR